jgi:hypothetical protein
MEVTVSRPVLSFGEGYSYMAWGGVSWTGLFVSGNHKHWLIMYGRESWLLLNTGSLHAQWTQGSKFRAKGIQILLSGSKLRGYYRFRYYRLFWQTPLQELVWTIWNVYLLETGRRWGWMKNEVHAVNISDLIPIPKKNQCVSRRVLLPIYSASRGKPISRLASCLNYSLTLMIEAVLSSETSVNSYRTTWRRTPEDSTLRNHRCENLKCKLEGLHYKHEPVVMNIVSCMSDSRRSFGLDNGFID